jgi:hypothetical protein
MCRRIGGLFADSTRVAQLCCDRLIENCGRMPSFSKIQFDNPKARPYGHRSATPETS